jgi:hypothetical protein
MKIYYLLKNQAKDILFFLLGVFFFLAILSKYGSLFLRFFPFGIVGFLIAFYYGITLRKKKNLSYKNIFSFAFFIMFLIILFFSVSVYQPQDKGAFSRSSIDHDF